MLVFICIRIWSAAYGRHYIQSFISFYFWLLFSHSTLSLTLVVHQSCFYFCSILFSNHTWELVFMWTVVAFFFEFLFVCLFVWFEPIHKNRSKVNFEILLWLNMVPTYNLDLSFNLKILFVREKKRFVAGLFRQFVCIKLLNYKKCDASMVTEKFDLNEWKYSFISMFMFKQNYIDT